MTQQLRLLLWKDYLIRKRKLITLVGVLWASLVVASLYIVRANIDNVDYPTCYFPARALPSAGMVPFLQSFICSVNNECIPPEQYEEIPAYENAKLTQLQRKFTPILYNDTVMEVAATVPDALKLLAKLSEIADEPTFIEFTKKGIRFRDLFKNPDRVESYLAKNLELPGDVARSIMTSKMNFEGIMKSTSKRHTCSSMIKELLVMTNQEHSAVLTDKVCSLATAELQGIMSLVLEVDFSKFIRMAGNMFYKLQGDDRIIELADTVPAVLRLSKLQNFLPMEVARILGQMTDYSYFDMALINKFLGLFKPTFTDTESYKNIEKLSDALVAGVQYLDKVLAKRHTDDTVGNTSHFVASVDVSKDSSAITALNDVSAIFNEVTKVSSVDVFTVMSPITNFIYKLLPNNMKHDVLFYSTLLAKLIESANRVINININLEERAYNASLRHPEALKILKGLSSVTIDKGFEALADAERLMMITKKIDDPGRIFCDVTKLQTFFEVNMVEAADLKNKLCTDDWKNYMNEMIKTFGIYEIKDRVNEMASILIQETLGKDTSSRLYTLDKDIEILKDFVESLSTMKSRPHLDWMKLFNISDESDFMKAVRRNGFMGKSILITIHGAIAREVVKQNTILSIKIAPTLIDTATFVAAINRQLAKTPKNFTDGMKNAYPLIVQTILRTALDEDKTYKALTTPSIGIVCNGVEHASSYLDLPQGTNNEELVQTLCDVTTTTENGLKKNSEIGKGIEAIRDAQRSSFEPIPWPALITGVKDLYVKLENGYPYLFEFSTYGMDNATRENTAVLMKEATEYWFGSSAMQRSLRLTIKFAFRILDILDRDIFDMKDDIWLKVKYTFMKVSGPIEVMDDLIRTIAAVFHNEEVIYKLPPVGVDAVVNIVPNLPQLMYELVRLIEKDSTDPNKVIDLINNGTWPCSAPSSLAEVLRLSPRSADTVRSMETLICMSNDDRNQWWSYLTYKGVGDFNLKNWNTTYPPHTFLRFSSALDMILDDSILLGSLARNLTNAGDIIEVLSNGDGDNFTVVIRNEKDLNDTLMVDGDHEELNDVKWSNVVERITKFLNSTKRDEVLRKFFKKLDHVINGVKTVQAQTDLSLNALWAIYSNCSGRDIDDHCRMFGRDAWKFTLEFFSVMLENVAKDISKYIKEINEPNVSVLQLLGFTEGTPLYEMYENLPSYISVLANSYWDHRFMSQIHRAAQTDFWDCEAVVDSLRPPPGSPVTKETLHSVKPYVCPSLLYWLSLPRGDNTILDLFAKPQYFLYTHHVDKFTSSYEEAFNTITGLYEFIADLAKNKKNVIPDDELTLNSIETKLNNFVHTATTYKMSKNDKFYKTFNEINEKQIASTVYLARVIDIINKIAIKTEEMVLPKDMEDQQIIQADLINIQKTFKRKPNEVIAVYFDMITDMVFNESFSLVKAWNTSCNNLKSKRFVISASRKLQTQICSKKYNIIFKDIDVGFDEDYDNARKSLLNLITVLRNGNSDNFTDVFEFLNNRSQLVNYMRNSIEYSYEFGIPVYLRYLLNQLQHLDIILTFLSGGDWWNELRSLYHGPHASKFLDRVERSFDIVEDVFNNLDDIHLVRLIRDINVNDSDIFCNDSVVLADYLPDATGLFSEMKKTICMQDKSHIYAEIPPLVFAAQGYEADLKLSKTVNESVVNAILSSIERRLALVRQGPEDPQTPSWVTEEKLEHLRKVANGLLSKETLTKITFGLIVNAVDAGTLFLNNSQCSVCSHLTTWLKQLNLQIFKKQEYDNLLCQMHDMSLEAVHHTLKHDFHWDMAIGELIATRNYTNLELNKSIQEFLQVVKLHLLEDLNSRPTKISGCLTKNVTKNAFGNATLFLTVLGHTARLLRSELPHLQEIDGIKNLSYLKDIETAVAHNLEVTVPLKSVLRKGMELEDMERIGGNVLISNVNLRSVTDLEQPLSVIMPDINWGELCETQDCKLTAETIHRNVNRTFLEKELATLQSQRFWSFDFLSNILYHVEELLSHSTRLLAVASKADLEGVVRGRLEALIDFLVQLMVEDTLNGVLYSLQGLTKELHPLLEGASLEFDLTALGRGLKVIQQFKNYLLDNKYFKIRVSEFFPVKEDIESSLHRQGINNTNFWSLAAPRIYLGQLDLTPIFSQKQGDFHISNYVCSIEEMSKVIIPGDIAAVTADDVYGAVAEQFCGMSDSQVKEMLPVLVQGLDLDAVVDKLKSILLPQLYEASNLTQCEGDLVLERYPRMLELMPVIQNSVGDLADTLAKEPLVKDLSGFSSVGGLLGSTNFLSNAGKMLCGKPFQMTENRFYNAVTSSKDYSTAIDPAQLDVLPTDFCRDMYKDIIHMQGGKILWTFIKPLVMGKILYTPSNPVTEMIMQKANSSFAKMIQLTSLVHSFAGSFPALDKVASHREGVSALRAAMSSLGPVFGGANLSTADVGGLFEDMGDFKDIGKVLKKGSDLLRCFDLNRFRAVADEFQLTHEAVKLSLVNEFSAGIVFLNTEGKEGLPKKIEYKIRMDIENVPTTARLRNYLWIPGPESSFIENMRYFRGFVQIQDMIDTAIIQLSRSSSRIQKRETRMEDETKWAVYTQQEPYPCYRKDFFQTSLYESQALLVAFFFSLLFTVSSVVRFIVQDKETGNTMLMSVMGVNLAYHTLSWFVVSLAEVALTCCCVCAVLAAGGVLPQTSVTLLLTLLLVMGLSALSFCYMMSKFFSSASFGAVCTAIAYLVTFMPFVLILSLEAVLCKIVKLIVCLAMSSSICYSFLYVARFEAMGRGAQWGDVFTGMDPEDLSIGVGAIMALVDAALYFAIGYLVDRYFGVAAVQSSIITCTTTDEKAGVSIVNVSKTYRGRWRREDRLALDNVSIELHKGQITALLGHNGAGKTTLINILTGMLKPSKGHVIVRSEAGATRVGVCAQRDVLHSHLTAYEHVVLYAQLKSGKRLDEVQDEVDSLLQVLSLGPVAHEPVVRLSGGTRRRLCVALAFVAKPQLVSLDEPTSGVDPAARSMLQILSLGLVAHEPVVRLSGGKRRWLCVALAFVAKPQLVSLDEPTCGVDPAARRDIWSMIVKLREDRTVLMTTHHLDEAELLSDQIVIMHKGQIHTIGSPIEIKRSLGNGYKLTVSYPCSEGSEEPSIEERSKQLMAVVRDSVPNASLVDVNGLDVEIGLPFFDANGLNNNFLQLCTSVEKWQGSLGYRSYSMDCSSLEQVFFNICHQADGATNQAYEYDPEMPSHSGNSSSTYSIRSNNDPLVPIQGPLKGTSWQQLTALLHARYLHYIRNRWLLFLLIVLPALFVGLAMGFSMIRPPADNEVLLNLTPGLYRNSTEYLVANPSVYSDIDTSFAEDVMKKLRAHKENRNWTSKDTPNCKCGDRRQECDLTEEDEMSHPQLMLLPNVSTLNDWIVASHDAYIEKRYGGYSASIRNNVTNFVVWYNNKGHHALPAFLSEMSRAIAASDVTIAAHAHTLKISQEQLTKDTVYQHVADAGISALVLIAYSLVSAGGAIYLVSSRRSQEKRLQLLCGVSPVVYWGAALACDMIIIVINLVITVILFQSFGFPVFVARNNLPAICLLIVLFGYACACLVHLAEKLFSEPSIANMLLFTGNSFVGLAGITVLLILDIISESDATDNARWTLHKVFLLSPQFALGDGLLEIAKNTIQAQVLDRFGMDTYKDPLSTALVAHHYAALALVGTALLLLNLAIEYDCFYGLWLRFRPRSADVQERSETEDAEVAAERKRVLSALTTADRPLRLPTIGNINAGFVNTEEITKTYTKSPIISANSDIAQCVALSKVYPSLSGPKVAVKSLTLGIPPGQCTALLGQNGAGKSTTFAMLTGEVRPTSGTIYLNEREVNNRQLCSGLISYCPQSDAIDALLTVRETLQMYCRLRGITEQDKVIKRTIEMFDLTKYADVKNGTLSGGNKRKLCTAIAFMGRTPLVLLDEPTSGMDPGSRGCVSRGAASACGGASRRGVLLSTHALRDARRLAGRVALVRAGRLATLASVDDCLTRFGGGYVVSCRVCRGRGAARGVWRRVRSRAPRARLQVLHQATVTFLLPVRATVDGKEVTTSLSDIFRLMAELQTTCDIDDYTVNQSSLDQMFLSFTEKTEEELDMSDPKSPAQPTPAPYDRLHSVTSL